MIIMGLHFGHDASVSIVRDGEVLICLERERISRIKHAIGLDSDTVNAALIEVDIALQDIDYVTVTSTQLVDFIFTRPQRLSFELCANSHGLPCSLLDVDGVSVNEFSRRSDGELDYVFSLERHQYHKYLPEGKNLLDRSLKIGSFESFILPNEWREGFTSIEALDRDFSELIKSDYLRYGFYYPVYTNIDGHKIPGFLFNHHYSHLAYSFYVSSFESSLCLTMDGGGSGDGYACGFYGWGKNNRIYPIAPHYYNIGGLYDQASNLIGFEGAPGKLMGLSGYGKPVFLKDKYIGNVFDTGKIRPKVIFREIFKQARKMGYNVSNFGNMPKIMDPINTDFAASIQSIVENSGNRAVDILHKLCKKHSLLSGNLSVSGGVFLNCPMNSRISNAHFIRSMFVPPATGDMGLSIGSALALYHNILDFPRKAKDRGPSLGYLGKFSSSTDAAIMHAIRKYSDRLAVEYPDNPAKSAAQDIWNNKVIGIFWGRSEIGARALGHRSIIANPTFLENKNRVNAIKRRENWRPFAPAVLADFIRDEYDINESANIYFMAFNASVLRHEYPAVTHIDGTARVQAVTQDAGLLYDILRELYNEQKMKVVLNTSFNGPGEPIIENADEAIDFLLSTEIDAVYFVNCVVRRAQ